MKRRQFISHVSAGLAGLSLGAHGQSQADDARGEPTFVFVHGAWHGGWCWSEVVRLLAQRGYPAIVLDLPGHGLTARFPSAYLQQPQDPLALATEVSPLAASTLIEYRDHVIQVIRGLTERRDRPVVLVGHSLGGGTLTLVGEAIPWRIHRLVYLTAFAPVVHNTIFAYLQLPTFAGSAAPALLVADPAVVGALRINHNSADPAYVARNRSAFYGDASEERFQAAANLLTPDEPLQAFLTPVVPTPTRWGRVARAFIRCTEDQIIPIALQDQMIAEADAFTPGNRFVQHTLPTSHSPFASDPAAVVEVLTALV